jgi:hypothetical protein
LTKKSPVVICPNPKCGKEIEESVMLDVLSVDPPKKYEACPYCFSQLEEEKATIKKEKVTEAPKKPEEPKREETKESSSRMFSRVKSLIPNRNKDEETHEKSAENNTKTGCPERFGYLANRPDGEPIPQYCLTCTKMVDCMLSPKEE